MTTTQIALAATVVFSPILVAQAPLPELLLTARTAYLVNQAGDVKRFDSLAKEFQKWGRFKLVDREDTADIVITFGRESRGQIGSMVNGYGSSSPVTAITLEIGDRASESLLWKDSSPVIRSPQRLMSRLRERMAKENSKRP